MKFLGMLDAGFLHMETRNTPMHAGALQIFTLPVDAPADYMQQLYAYLRKFQVPGPPFNYRLSRHPLAGLMPAVEELRSLDLDYHVRHSALPKPGGERELGILVSYLHSRPLDLRKPLWEFHLIEGLENRRFAVYFKGHHAISDGIKGMQLLQSSLGETPDTLATPVWALAARRARLKVVPREAVPSPRNLYRQRLGVGASSVRQVTRALGTMARSTITRNASGPVGPYTAPRCVLNPATITPHRRYATQVMDMARILKLCALSGGTVNDVVLTLAATGLRRYLLDINALPAQPLVANVPVSVRPQGEVDQANAISVILTSLATDVADIAARFVAVRESAGQAKAHLQTLSGAAIPGYTMALFGPNFLGQVAHLPQFGRPIANLVISNVPGPRRPLYLNGARMEGIYPVSVLPEGQALNITVMTYADRLTWGFTADRDSLPRVQRLAVYTGEALDELEQALAGAETSAGAA